MVVVPHSNQALVGLPIGLTLPQIWALVAFTCKDHKVVTIGPKRLRLKLVIPLELPWLLFRLTGGLVPPPIDVTVNGALWPAAMSPCCQAADACAQVEYRPLLLSQATISNVAAGASTGIIVEYGGTALSVSLMIATSPSAMPLRNVVVWPTGTRALSGWLEPTAPISWARVVA